MNEVPVVDIREGDAAQLIDAACREVGFFSIVGHEVSPELAARLDSLSREFFALPDEAKADIAMPLAGRAWRGWFPVHGELTSGKPDRKEGIYFGTEDDPHDARVMHGRNLWPAAPVGLEVAVTEWLAAMRGLADRLMSLVATGLGLQSDWFETHLTAAPTELFRIFHYPPGGRDDEWGVGTHTDYGLLTILMQDDCGGLQVRSRQGWVEVPPLPGAFVCNIGDMLDRLTGGRYRSTPHRVRNESGRSRLSFPYFFDPSWDAVLAPIPLEGEVPDDDAAERWDGRSVHAAVGTYGDYLTAKIGKVFPELGKSVESYG